MEGKACDHARTWMKVLTAVERLSATRSGRRRHGRRWGWGLRVWQMQVDLLAHSRCCVGGRVSMRVCRGCSSLEQGGWAHALVLRYR